MNGGRWTSSSVRYPRDGACWSDRSPNVGWSTYLSSVPTHTDARFGGTMDSFWSAFLPNLVAALLGVIFGLPPAMWVDRVARRAAELGRREEASKRLPAQAPPRSLLQWSTTTASCVCWWNASELAVRVLKCSGVGRNPGRSSPLASSA